MNNGRYARMQHRTKFAVRDAETVKFGQLTAMSTGGIGDATRMCMYACDTHESTRMQLPLSLLSLSSADSNYRRRGWAYRDLSRKKLSGLALFTPF